MRLPTRQSKRAKRRLARAEEGAALLEGILTLLLFLPVWMFIIYAGTAGMGLAQAYQAARSELWTQQVNGDSGNCSVPPLNITINASGMAAGYGSTAYSIGRDTKEAEITPYATAMGFPGFVRKTSVAGCVAIQRADPAKEPSFTKALLDFAP